MSGVPDGAVALQRCVGRIVVRAIGQQPAFRERDPFRSAGFALLRRDEHDAVRRVRAVERRGRRSLHDLDVLDVVRIQIVASRRLRAAESVGERHLRRHAHAVDDVDRRVVQAHAVRAANANARADARLHSGLHADARNARVEHVAQISHRLRLGDVRHGDVRDRVAELHASLLAGGRRDDFVELEDGLRHREVERRGLIGDGVHRLLLRLKSDVQHAHLDGAGRHVVHGVAAIRGGDRAERRAHHEDADIRDRLHRWSGRSRGRRSTAAPAPAASRRTPARSPPPTARWTAP